MSMNLFRAAMAMLVAAILAGCEGNAGGSSGQAANAPVANGSSPNPTGAGDAQGTPAGTYAPDGLDGATVTIQPVGKALISIVDGYPARIFEKAAKDGYRQARLMPGDHILHVGTTEARQGLNLKFSAGGGDYFALALTYVANGELFWTPVIVSGGPDGPIVADKDGILTGKTLAEAEKLLTARQVAAARRKVAEGKKPGVEAQGKTARKEAAAKVRALLAKAVKASEAGQLEEALKTVDEALTVAPGFDSALILRGVVLARLKKPEAALESLEKGLEIGRKVRGANDESLHRAWLEKGLILMSKRQMDRAHEALSESIRLKPTARALLARANMSFARGQALGKKDDWNGAEPYFKSAQADAGNGIGLNPKSPKFWSIKTGTHIMLNEHEQACQAMRKTCELGKCSILEQYPQCKPGGS